MINEKKNLHNYKNITDQKVRVRVWAMVWVRAWFRLRIRDRSYSLG